MNCWALARKGTNMKCQCCGQETEPTLSEEEYKARAIPRLAAIDRLAEKIDFTTEAWKCTPEGERYQRLMNEQGADEVAAGL